MSLASWSSRRRLAALAGVVLALCPASTVLAQEESWEPCELRTPGAPRPLEADCRLVPVPRDPARPEAGEVELAVARWNAVRRDAASDPVVFLAGGPGQAAKEVFVLAALSLDRLHRGRDFLFLDQRGTGGSEPFVCEMGEGWEEPDEAEMKRLLEACREDYEPDSRWLRTEIAVEDLEAVRQRLGYPALNLVGVSYGTRVAQAYARRYPERTRTMVLDSVVPLDAELPADVAGHAQRALDLIFARCREAPGCREAFSDPGATFHQLLEGLRAEPRAVEVPHPRTARPEALDLEGSLVARAVRLLTYSPEVASVLPFALDRAARDDWGPLLGQVISSAEGLGSTMATGMNFSVICAEDAPFIDWESANARSASTYLGAGELDLIERVCRDWPVSQVDPEQRRPLRSAVPTLVLSGQADPVTPPAYGERVVSGLESGLHLVLPEMGHHNLPRGCVPRVVADFVEAGTPEGLDHECTQELRALPFFIDAVGPTP